MKVGGQRDRLGKCSKRSREVDFWVGRCREAASGARDVPPRAMFTEETWKAGDEI